MVTDAPKKAKSSQTKKAQAKPSRGQRGSAMSAEHKEALALGREEGRAVRRYLEALEAHRPRRGRRRTPEVMRRRLSAIEADLLGADPLSRVHLVQERMNLEAELAEAEDGGVDMSELEDAFVQAAAGYSSRKRISYTAWREAGVDAAVLKRAGIARDRS